MKKRIVLCADDYGQAPAISQGILALVKNKRISAVSCMVTLSDWPEHAAWLLPFRSQIDIGLHFNLTEGKSSLVKLMGQALCRRLDYSAILAELHQQIDAFIQGMGCLPDFIDGHQHVHQLPIVRDALIMAYQQRLQAHGAYVRLVKQKINSGSLSARCKKFIVHTLGTHTLETLLLKQRIAHNASFSGMYDFVDAQRYAQFFPEFLLEINDGGLIMCHPALLSSSATDPIAESRYYEYQYLNSSQYLANCLDHGVIIGRFKLNQLNY